jgi:hypothetical protein
MDKEIAKERNCHKSENSLSASALIERGHDLGGHPKIKIRRDRAKYDLQKRQRKIHFVKGMIELQRPHCYVIFTH